MPRRLFYFICFILIQSFLGCSPDSPQPSILLKPTCLLFSSIFESSSVDDAGMVTQRQSGTTMFNVVDTTYTISTGTTTVKLDYDQNQFLTKRRVTTYPKAILEPVKARISQTVYTYSNGRLTQAVDAIEEEGVLTSQMLHQYSYDANGELSRDSATSASGKQTIRTFINGVQQDYVVLSPQGQPITDQTFSFSAQGYQVKAVFGEVLEYHNQYDTWGNLIRHEEWIKGQLVNYTEYKVGPLNQQGQAYLLPKGHPRIPDIVGSEHNLKSQATYYSTNTINNQLKKKWETTYQYDFDPRGLVIAERNTRYDYYSDGTIYTTTTEKRDNIYIGCR